jgi:hypothetical protein
LRDVWGARDRYVDVAIGALELDELLARESSYPLDERARRRAADLLEMQRNALAMFTSCAWFFSDPSGIETVQILRYAQRTLELLDDLGGAPTEAFLTHLEQAKSNDPSVGTARDIYESLAPATVS